MRSPGRGRRGWWAVRLGLLLLLTLVGLTACWGKGGERLKVGDQAPPFTGTDLQGQPLTLAAVAGKPVLLRFFVPNCKFCRADTAVFNEFYEKYHSKGLQIVYINTDPNLGEAKKFAEELGIAFPIVVDADRKIAEAYRVKLVPQTILLSPQHTIVGAILGGVSGEAIQELMGTYLQ